ncbi:hypothetical protein GCM10020254_51720 [Streptomyces goshikiensis]
MAATLAALWRARRLGPLVTEQLPVAVRASEAAEGRARLYHKAGARDRAATVLRAATRERLAALVGVPPGRAHAPESLVPGVCARLPGGAHDVTTLLFGPTPRRRRGTRRARRPTRRPRKRGPHLMTATTDSARSSLEAIRTEIGKAVVGQDPAVTGLVVALLCRGHVLLEGVPGVAKTLLVRALAASLELDTKRVQFTPDLMPSDVTGSLVYDARTAEFSFQNGPVFTNLLLADEINRTPPKTQSSLLEAMEERQVTVDGTPRALPEPFLVAATMNPVEYEGTYPSPKPSWTASSSNSPSRCPPAPTRSASSPGTPPASTRATCTPPASAPSPAPPTSRPPATPWRT